MPENAAAGFVQHEAPQSIVIRDPARLFPERVAGWRLDAGDDDIADLALRVASDDLYYAARLHASLRAEARV